MFGGLKSIDSGRMPRLPARNVAPKLCTTHRYSTVKILCTYTDKLPQ